MADCSKLELQRLTVTQRVGGMFSSNVEAERSRRHESVSATRRSSRARYGGAMQAMEGKYSELEFDPLWHA